ncbi:trypsin-like peptidase domain-containing protein [Candidatus Berkelbacteria bacterium]|nr:trypsin-like peptidase domain-containing protein [Candidatus Berkelbacteria bacterium]
MPPKKDWKILLAWAAVGSFLISFIWVVVILYFLSATPIGEKWREKLGLDDLKALNINSTKTEKLVIEESSAIINASKDVSRSVVSISVKGEVQTRNIFGQGIIQNTEASGTGFIVTNDGLIATNKHVIEDGTEFEVTTSEGKSYKAKLAGKDPVTDIALLKIEARGLPVVEIGDSDKIEVGQWVIAIGNALGEFQNSVTVGVVSGLNRRVDASDSNGSGAVSLDGIIQTDAAINPGNSGGPLITLKGQVIGINTAISASGQNLGFVIPSNELKKSLESYLKNGKILRPYMGVRYDTLTKVKASSYKLNVEQGAYIFSQGSPAVIAGSPAEKAGLKSGDIIIKVETRQVTEQYPLARIIRQYNPGDSVELTIIRDSKEQKIRLTFGTLGD